MYALQYLTGIADNNTVWTPTLANLWHLGGIWVACALGIWKLMSNVPYNTLVPACKIIFRKYTVTYGNKTFIKLTFSYNFLSCSDFTFS